MRGSRIPNPVIFLAGVVAAATLFGVSAQAADVDSTAPASGQPIVLFSPNALATTLAAHSPASTPAAPARRPVAPVQRIPLDGKPLIPPATMPAKLGPPPDPQPALSLETDLQPVGQPTPTAAPQTPATNPAAQPSAAKSPPG
jgi:hypothetical protein